MEKSLIMFVGTSRGADLPIWFADAKNRQQILCDPQNVALANIDQSAFVLEDVGRSKVGVVADRVQRVRPNADVQTFQCRAQEISDLGELLHGVDLGVVGVDDMETMFELADMGSLSGTDMLIIGTTGDNEQFFVAGVLKGGVSLQILLPGVWQAVLEGLKPPEFFPSCRLHAETLNIAAFRIALGLLHYRGGSTLPIAETGRAFVERPLLIGLNGIHAESGFVMPMRLMPPPRAA